MKLRPHSREWYARLSRELGGYQTRVLEAGNRQGPPLP
ncbi:hypothetical protein HNQ10_001303 [Deinococcus metallilatus]|uniref:Uncharacterized protein n=1 Tax=Deinococcus metallilatus TaxID=1211322 RepID=A0ABR6MRZ2_9DEIO|nr:hypothetical protein [Deinococcus metallilatus]